METWIWSGRNASSTYSSDRSLLHLQLMTRGSQLNILWKAETAKLKSNKTAQKFKCPLHVTTLLQLTDSKAYKPRHSFIIFFVPLKVCARKEYIFSGISMT